MNIPITRVQVQNLEMGFTPTGSAINRRQRRSKEYQKMLKDILNSPQTIQMPENDETITLSNFTTDEEGKLIKII